MDEIDMGGMAGTNQIVKEEEVKDVVMATEEGENDAHLNGHRQEDDAEVEKVKQSNEEQGAKPDSADEAVKSEQNGTAAAPTNSQEAKSETNNATAATQVNNHPVLIGTLSYSEQEGARRQHQIRGNWKYENAAAEAAPAPQRFELIRTIPPDEDLHVLPADGEFHGTFSLFWQYPSKGKMKSRSKNVAETGVKIAFTPQDEPGVFSVKGTGLNEYGQFDLIGTATKSTLEDDPGYHVRLTKIYTQLTVQEEKKEVKEDPIKKPPPTNLPAENVVCLRGKYTRNTSQNLSLGLGDVVHNISGVWAMGLNFILEDATKCNKFEYEHKSSGESTAFPLSGKYTGWFYVDKPDNSGDKNKIPERDVTIKFIENNEGYHNVEGKGSNLYGRYIISGTLDKHGIITLFRQFQAQKIKVSSKKAREASTLISTPAPGLLKLGDTKGVSTPIPSLDELPLSFDDIEAPDGSELVPPIDDPTVYGAVSKGIFKITDDGHHSCSGHWAIHASQLSSGETTSSFHFGINPNVALADATTMLERLDAIGATKHDNRKKKLPDRGGPTVLANATFPVDSARYRGSFKMRRGVSKFTTVKDEQVILKFVKNNGGSYNVYGKGTNYMGVYEIIGTLIPQTDTSGHLKLFRIYPAETVKSVSQPTSKSSGKVFPGSLTEKAVGGRPSMNPPEKFTPSASSLQRRESGRQVKAPMRLEEDDPEAQRASSLEKCRLVLKDLMSKDLQNIFAIPVDPVALNIPTYFDIIHEPMDLGTIHTQLENGELVSPDEFIRLVRLVFENAIKFNTMPDSYVAITARSLLTFFNSKIGGIERTLQGAKNKKLSKAEFKEKDAKKKGKRKSLDDGGSGHKRGKLSEYMNQAKPILDSITTAASHANGTVTRTEFDSLLQLVKLQHDHMVALHRSVLKHTASSYDANRNSLYASTSFEIEDSRKSISPKKKKPKTEKHEKKSKPPPSPEYYPTYIPVENLEPLSLEEQQALSEDINGLSEHLLPGAMDIIRESDGVNDEDEEIDLDLDMLDVRTQRKLQQYIAENVKPKRKKDRKRRSAPVPIASAPSPQSEKQPSAVNTMSKGKSFFSMGQDDSDSDDDQDMNKCQVEMKNDAAPSADQFALDDDIDDEEDDDLNADAIAANWVTTSSQDANPEEDAGQDAENDEDDLWGAAKKEAEASKALEADRAKREEKMIAEANMAMQKRMEEAQALGKEVRAKREEEAANEARRVEEQEREAENARNVAREKALQEVNDVKNTIDLDAQRELMKQYEQEFNDNYSAGASPSSDFGF